MIFKDKQYIIQVLQELIPFPTNLRCLDSFDFNFLIDLLVDHYALSKFSLEIDFDKIYTRIELKELYKSIFGRVKLEGTVIMHPLYRESGSETVTFQAPGLYSFLLQEHPRLTKRFKLEGVGEEDVLFIFVEQRIIVNINHRGSSYICTVDKELVETGRYLRPTLLFGKVFLWPDLLEKGNYKLKYSSDYLENELADLSLVVDEILEFPLGVKLGKKYPVIAQNISLQSCGKLKEMLDAAGVRVTIEEEPDFTSTVYYSMPTDEPDVVDGNILNY
jgi:hypothetical protein